VCSQHKVQKGNENGGRLADKKHVGGGKGRGAGSTPMTPLEQNLHIVGIKHKDSNVRYSIGKYVWSTT